MGNPEAIQQAIKICGGTQKSLADRIGRTQQLISSLLKGATISAETALLIETATERKVRAHTLRPDLFTAPRQRARPQVPA